MITSLENANKNLNKKILTLQAETQRVNDQEKTKKVIASYSTKNNNNNLRLAFDILTPVQQSNAISNAIINTNTNANANKRMCYSTVNVKKLFSPHPESKRDSHCIDTATLAISNNFQKASDKALDKTERPKSRQALGENNIDKVFTTTTGAKSKTKAKGMHKRSKSQGKDPQYEASKKPNWIILAIEHM